MTRISERKAPSGIWAHHKYLPDVEPHFRVSLGEGSTPVIPLTNTSREFLNGARLLGKAEYLNPTGSFKDRVAAVAVSLAQQRKRRFILGTSSGNGGAAISAYGARAGLPVFILTSPNAAQGKLDQIAAAGGQIIHVEEMGSGAVVLDELIPTVRHICEVEGGDPFLAGFRYMPEAMQGVSTIWSELQGEAPDRSVIYAPVGGGGLVTGLHRGIAESKSTTTIVGVQPQGCNTLVRALNGTSGRVDRINTQISGLQVAQLFDEEGAVQAIQATAGHVVEVSDDQILAAQRLLAKTEGLLVEPAGAVALAGAIADANNGLITEDTTVIVVLTGAAHKDRHSLVLLSGGPFHRSTTVQLGASVARLLDSS